MAEDYIDSLINRGPVKKEFDETIADAERLLKVIIDTANGAVQMNSALSKSTGFSDFGAKSKAATDSIDKLQKAQEKQIQNYYANQAKQEAAAALAYAREVDAAQKQAAKLVQIEQDKQAKLDAAAAKKASRDGGTFRGGSGDSRELTTAEAEAIDAKNRALDAEAAALANKATAESKSTQESQKATQQTQQETEAISASQRIINQATGTLAQNISQQVKLQTELKGVQAQLKAGTGDTAKLTQQEVLLKAAIQQNSVVIKQLAKDEISTDSAASGVNARLTLLRTTYNDLTKAERDNAQIGGVLLAEIKQLDPEVKKIAEDQGVYNKSVGDYENKIKSAIAAYVPYGNQIIKGVDNLKSASEATEGTTSNLGKLGFAFAGFTIAGFAIAISAASFYLSQFQGTADKVDIALSGLKARFGQVGKSISDNLFDSKTSEKSANSFGNQFVKQLGKVLNFDPISNAFRAATGITARLVLGPTDAAAKAGEAAAKSVKKFEDLNNITEITVKKQQGLAQQQRAEAKDVSLSNSERIAKLEEAEKTEQGVIDLQKKRGEDAVKLGIQVGNIYNTLDTKQIKALQAGDIQLATSLFRESKLTKDGYELYKSGLEQRIETLNQSNLLEDRIRNDHSRLELKDNKAATAERKKIFEQSLKDAKDNEEAALSDEDSTFDDRIKAANDYYDKVIEITNKGLKQKVINEKQAGTIITETATIIDKAKLKNDKDAKKNEAKTFEDGYKELLKLQQKYIDDQRDLANQQLLGIEKDRADDLAGQAQLYADGKINATQYAQAIYDIDQKASSARIDRQIEDIEKVIAKQKEDLEFGIGNDKLLQASENDLTKLKIDKSNLETKTKLDNAEKLRAKLKQLHDYERQLAEAGIDLIKQLGDNSFDSESKKLQDKSDAIDKQAALDKAAVDKSLLTSQQKADKEAAIDAKAAADKEEVAKQERLVERQKAEFDKAIAIAKIVESTAIAVAEVLPNFILAGIIAAIGAVQLASVLAQPLPAFADGTKNHPGGWSLFGEAGTERVTEPGKKPYFTDGATVGYLPRGTVIESNSDLMRAMAWPGKPVHIDNQLNLSALMQQNDRHNKELKQALSVKQAANYNMGRRDEAKFRKYLNRNIN